MTWTYEQASGRLSDDSGNLVGVGYSGRQPDGKNKPEMQEVRDIGPLPQGLYRIGTPVDTITHGPFVLPLGPDSTNEMFLRSGFLIHGDSVTNPGTASEGCIIMARSVREAVWDSNDRALKVVSGL